jgi:hypothetical protein
VAQALLFAELEFSAQAEHSNASAPFVKDKLIRAYFPQMEVPTELKVSRAELVAALQIRRQDRFPAFMFMPILSVILCAVVGNFTTQFSARGNWDKGLRFQYVQQDSDAFTSIASADDLYDWLSGAWVQKSRHNMKRPGHNTNLVFSDIISQKRNCSGDAWQYDWRCPTPTKPVCTDPHFNNSLCMDSITLGSLRNTTPGFNVSDPGHHLEFNVSKRMLQQLIYPCLHPTTNVFSSAFTVAFDGINNAAKSRATSRICDQTNSDSTCFYCLAVPHELIIALGGSEDPREWAMKLVREYQWIDDATEAITASLHVWNTRVAGPLSLGAVNFNVAFAPSGLITSSTTVYPVVNLLTPPAYHVALFHSAVSLIICLVVMSRFRDIWQYHRGRVLHLLLVEKPLTFCVDALWPAVYWMQYRTWFLSREGACAVVYAALMSFNPSTVAGVETNKDNGLWCWEFDLTKAVSNTAATAENDVVSVLLWSRRLYDTVDAMSLVVIQDTRQGVLVTTVMALLTLRLFRFFNLQPRLAVIMRTLMRAAPDLIHFGFILLLLMMAFAAIGSFLWGMHTDEFGTPWQACLTVFFMLMGNSDDYYDMMAETAPTAAPIFTIAYLTLMVTISMNLLLAIVVDSYEEVTEAKGGEEYSFPSFWESSMEDLRCKWATAVWGCGKAASTWRVFRRSGRWLSDRAGGALLRGTSGSPGHSDLKAGLITPEPGGTSAVDDITGSVESRRGVFAFGGLSSLHLPPAFAMEMKDLSHRVEVTQAGNNTTNDYGDMVPDRPTPGPASGLPPPGLTVALPLVPPECDWTDISRALQSHRGCLRNEVWITPKALREALQASSGVDTYCGCGVFPRGWRNVFQVTLAGSFAYALGSTSNSSASEAQNWAFFMVAAAITLLVGLARAYIPACGAKGLVAATAPEGHWTASLTVEQASSLLLKFAQKNGPGLGPVAVRT